MKVQFNLQGKERKQLVEQISKIVEDDIKYLGVPSCDYQIGTYLKVNKEGILYIDSLADMDVVKNLLDELMNQEYVFEMLNENKDTLEISVAIENFSNKEKNNLDNLISSKSSLLKKAIGTPSLDYIVDENKIIFPWFKANKNQEELLAYQQLTIALIGRAKSATRINPEEKVTNNEKFSFRVFLVSLGMKGEQFKVARKVLLKNLTGNSAFKNGGNNHAL